MNMISFQDFILYIKSFLKLYNALQIMIPVDDFVKLNLSHRKNSITIFIKKFFDKFYITL